MMLKDKVIAVFGGSGLIGSAVVKECAAEGAQVVIVDVRKPATPPSGSKFIECDATDEDSVRTSIYGIKKDFGRIDGIVNSCYPKTKNFGTSFKDGEIEEKLENITLHVKTCMTIVRACEVIFEKQQSGSIVFFGSIYGIAAPRFEIYEGTSMQNVPEYTVAKGGIIALTKYFASYLGKFGVRVNSVSPGGVADNQPASFVEAYSKHLLVGHGLVSQDDVAGGVAFLLSDKAKKITAQNLVIDGGWSA